MERLFIYGTLAPGQINHHILQSIPGHWEKASVKGKLLKEGWGSAHGFPGLVPVTDGENGPYEDNTKLVQGYLFSSEKLSSHWSMLDEFEGPGYQRQLVEVKTINGESFQGFVYALNH